MSVTPLATHCPSGHEYNEKNTHYRLESKGTETPRLIRKCLVCRAAKKARKSQVKEKYEQASPYQHIPPDTSEGKWRDRGDGCLELINEKGEVISVEAKKEGKSTVQMVGRRPGRPTDEVRETHHFVKDGTGKDLWVPKGTNPDTLPATIYPYSKITCDHILQFVSEGKTLNAIGEMQGIPPTYVIFRWMREHPEFKGQMNEAKKMRAEWRADKVMAIAEQEEIDEADVPGARLRSDLLKWGAAVDDQDTYGKQSKVTGNQGSVNIVIVTGVPDPIDVQSEQKASENVGNYAT